MINKFVLLIVAFTIFFFIACRSKEPEYIIGSLDNAFLSAKNKEKFLLVVSKNSECSTCDVLLEKLRKDQDLKNRIADNFIIYEYSLNVVGSEFLSRIFHSIATPTVYVFDPTGRFLTMYEGYKSFEKFEKSISAILANDAIPSVEDSKLSLSGDQLIRFSNQMLTGYNVLRKKEVKRREIDNAIFDLERSLQVQSYFFNNYLLSKLYNHLGDILKSKEYAKEALHYDKSFDIFLYQPLRNELKYIVDSNFSAESEPVLSVYDSEFDYGVVKIKSRPKATFTIKNQGKKPLIIQKLLPSCDCIKASVDKSTIAPGEQGKIEIIFEADSQGSFSKIVYVFSNSLKGFYPLSIKGIVD